MMASSQTNPHVVCANVTNGYCVVFYSQDLRIIHSMWMVPGTVDLAD